LSRFTLLVSLALVSLAIPRASAHETDQFTVPPGREFADVGPLISQWAYDSIHRAVNNVNEEIKHALESADKDAVKRLQTDHAVVTAVNKSFPWAMDVIEGWEKRLNDRETWNRYPGKVVIYKQQFDNIMKNSHFILDPRQIMRIWLAGTFKAFDTYMGSDKIGHFTDMGMNYWREYDKARNEGATKEQAIRRGIGVGERGLLFSERGLVGYLTAGAYSNGDMAANYLGFCFYRNLTEPMMLKGEVRKPMLVLEGDYWKIAPHIDRDTFFALFVSDHMDEALNPSHYEHGMRSKVRDQIAKRCNTLMEHYRDANGQRRSRDWFDKKHEACRTYWGEFYGHLGPREELIRLADVAFTETGGDGDSNVKTLHSALAMGDVTAARSLLSQGANPNAPLRRKNEYDSEWGSTPLHFAARDGRRDAAQALLTAGASVNAKNDAGVTPLHRAVDAGDAELCTMLLGRGADVNAVDANGRTPLHYAAAIRQESGLNYAAANIVSLLLRSGANANAQDREKRTPLHRAAEARNTAAVSALLAGGAKADAVDQFNTTPLHVSASNNDVPTARALLVRGAVVNARDDFGSTPLLDASRHGARQAVALLLDGGADPSLADVYGYRPLDIATRMNEAAVARLLARPSGDGARPAGTSVPNSGGGRAGAAAPMSAQ
jgi:ankyrin repeat protein